MVYGNKCFTENNHTFMNQKANENNNYQNI